MHPGHEGEYREASLQDLTLRGFSSTAAAQQAAARALAYPLATVT